MPSHMHTRDDLNFSRGYMWWILQQAKARNPSLTLIATPWVGNGNFWSQDAANYDLKWLEGLRKVYGLEVTSIGARNEKGVNFDNALPFGQINLNPTNDAYPFTSLERDAENQSDVAAYRHYASAQGRWLSPDPYNGSLNLLDPQSFNRYAYVGNRPMNSTDPSGLCDDSGDGCSNGGDGGDGEVTGWFRKWQLGWQLVSVRWFAGRCLLRPNHGR